MGIGTRTEKMTDGIYESRYHPAFVQAIEKLPAFQEIKELLRDTAYTVEITYAKTVTWFRVQYDVEIEVRDSCGRPVEVPQTQGSEFFDVLHCLAAEGPSLTYSKITHRVKSFTDSEETSKDLALILRYLKSDEFLQR